MIPPDTHGCGNGIVASPKTVCMSLPYLGRRQNSISRLARYTDGIFLPMSMSFELYSSVLAIVGQLACMLSCNHD